MGGYVMDGGRMVGIWWEDVWWMEGGWFSYSFVCYYILYSHVLNVTQAIGLQIVSLSDLQQLQARNSKYYCTYMYMYSTCSNSNEDREPFRCCGLMYIVLHYKMAIFLIHIIFHVLVNSMEFVTILSIVPIVGYWDLFSEVPLFHWTINDDCTNE